MGEGREPVYEVVSPIGTQRKSQVDPAPGFPDLSGKRVAFVWDLLFSGDLVWDTISKELANRYDGMEFVGYQEFGDIHGADERQVIAQLPDRLHQLRIDALLAGVGA
jgi:hypothetical protein